jgi:hypothetical protein
LLKSTASMGLAFWYCAGGFVVLFVAGLSGVAPED